MANIDLKQYARRGAEARIVELTHELDAIYRAFPDLRKTTAVRRPAKATSAAAPAPTQRRRRRAMTAAQKREVSLRMKKYWAARKKAEGK